MEQDKQIFDMVSRQDINVDMMNLYHFVNPESSEGKRFDAQMHKIMAKLWQKCQEQAQILNDMNIHFCIQDNQDISIARVMSSDFPTEAWDLSGNNFVVAFTKEKLGLLKNEDEVAFVIGHELSHLLYQKKAPKMPDGYDEENSCDMNSMRRMAEAGMNLESALSVDDIYLQKSEEMQFRREERKELIMKLCLYNKPTLCDFSSYKDVSFQPLDYKFTMPELNDSEEQKVTKMTEGLKEVFAVGGREAYQEKLKGYFDKVGSEEASRQLLLLTAKIFSDFPEVDSVKTTQGYRKYINHPLCVVSGVAGHVNSMPGKKLYPPEAVRQIREGIKRNPYFLRGMEKLWDNALSSQNIQICGREGR